jgi:hypothetical protein
VNPALATLVVPTPLQAPELPNAPCEMEVRRSRLRVCAFGVPREQARTTVALIGDSHASALRPAFDRVARDRGWRALSITRTGCPLSQAVLDTREPARSNCVQWNAEVTAWLREHPEVTTVFAASRVGTRVVHDAAEEDGFTARRRGFLEAWRALPPSVTRVVAIRDTPNMRDGTQACVSGAMGTGRDPGLACAVPRREALGGDAQVAAVELDRSGRLASVDLTDQLCDGLRCFPVVGGALVFRDEDHLNAVFAATLAPMLGRQADRAMTG